MRVVVATLLVLACAPAPDTRDATVDTRRAEGSPLLPDTQTVDGVLEMRYGAGALAQVAEWTLDTMPERIYDDPTGEIDLGMVSHVVPFSDGRVILTGVARIPGLVLFGRDGRLERTLARRGEGPGELGGFIWRNVVVIDDTAMVFDQFRRRVSRYTAAGFVGDSTFDGPLRLQCGWPVGHLDAVRRFVYACGADGPDDTSSRPMRRIGIGLLGSERVIATVPGLERRRRVEQTTAGMQQVWGPRTLGRTTQVVAWSDVIVVATQDSGYRLEILDTSGTTIGRIALDVPAVPVTQAIRDAEIAKALEWARRDDGHGGYRPGELERQAREQPIADTLPPHGELFVASDGVLWVMSPATWADTSWSALGFRRDGAIVARLRGSGDRTRRPIWFGEGRVMVREVDEDGVVRVGVHAVLKHRVATDG